MKINDNGIIRNMTPEEIAEYQSMQVIQDIPSYKDRVEARIRERYSVSDELAILRQKDKKPEEYAEYYAYVENCKAKEKTGV